MINGSQSKVAVHNEESWQPAIPAKSRKLTTPTQTLSGFATLWLTAHKQ